MLLAAERFIKASPDELSVVWVNYDHDTTDWEGISEILSKSNFQVAPTSQTSVRADTKETGK